MNKLYKIFLCVMSLLIFYYCLRLESHLEWTQKKIDWIYDDVSKIRDDQIDQEIYGIKLKK